MIYLFIFLILMAIGIPIAFVMLITSFLFVNISAPRLNLMIINSLYSGMNNYSLIALPGFIMIANIMTKSKVTYHLIKLAECIVGQFQGGLAHVNVLTSTFFAGISGAALSDVASLSLVFVPEMEEQGYSRGFAAAVTAASSIQSPIIPPSVMAVLYASVMGVSTGALFIAGVIPGLLIALSQMILIYFISKKRGYPRRERKIPFMEFLLICKNALPGLLLPVIILGGILSGIFTTTEAASVGVIYALFLGFVFYRTLKLKDILPILLSSIIVSSQLLFILAGGKALSMVMATQRIHTLAGNYILSFSDNKYLLLIVINLVLLFLGMWLDPAGIIVLLSPMLAPTLIRLGLHPIHIGLFMILNVMIGNLTPPLGLCLFAGASASNVSYKELVRNIWPFVIVSIIVLFIVTFIPDTVLYLVRLAGIIN